MGELNSDKYVSEAYTQEVSHSILKPRRGFSEEITSELTVSKAGLSKRRAEGEEWWWGGSVTAATCFVLTQPAMPGE